MVAKTTHRPPAEVITGVEMFLEMTENYGDSDVTDFLMTSRATKSERKTV